MTGGMETATLSTVDCQELTLRLTALEQLLVGYKTEDLVVLF